MRKWDEEDLVTALVVGGTVITIIITIIIAGIFFR